MAVLGLRFSARAFSSCGKRGPLFIAVRGPLLLRSTGSRRAGSVTVAHGPSCSAACGIFPDQGSNPGPLHWQADSQPLHHQGSPKGLFRRHFVHFLSILNYCATREALPGCIQFCFFSVFPHSTWLGPFKNLNIFSCFREIPLVPFNLMFSPGNPIVQLIRLPY